MRTRVLTVSLPGTSPVSHDRARATIEGAYMRILRRHQSSMGGPIRWRVPVGAGIRLVALVAGVWALATPTSGRAATFRVTAGDVARLIAAIHAANDEGAHPGPDRILLEAG